MACEMCTRSTIYIAPATIYEERSVAPVNNVDKVDFAGWHVVL